MCKEHTADLVVEDVINNGIPQASDELDLVRRNRLKQQSTNNDVLTNRSGGSSNVHRAYACDDYWLDIVLISFDAVVNHRFADSKP